MFKTDISYISVKTFIKDILSYISFLKPIMYSLNSLDSLLTLNLDEIRSKNY